MLIVPTEKHFDWKHAPLVLIAIVLTNLFVFIFYQSQDIGKVNSAIVPFVENNMLEQEWSLFERYLEREDRTDDLREARSLYQNQQYWLLSQYMLSETEYFSYALRAARSEIPSNNYEQWRQQRSEIQDVFNSRSAYAFGLRSTAVSSITLITHQFLHGGVMHIFGNLLFLVVFGFAVEAALGHLKFLCFYLIGGVIAGLAQVFTTLGSDIPLVGASGAISGVMAMYLAVFRLRKIEFFYWIFFFVGYFRAPALLILPFYIGKEIYSFYTAEGSNVAFMAHAGGFVGGGLLIGLALLFNRDVLNDNYIEEDQKISPRQKALAAVYQAIESLRFDYALKQLNSYLDQTTLDFELALIKFNLEKIKKGESYQESFKALMNMNGLSAEELKHQEKLWLETQDAENLCEPEDQLALAFRFTHANTLTAAESIFEGLHQKMFKPAELILLANKLAKRFADRNDVSKSRKFQEISQQLAAGGHHGIL